MYRCFAVLLGVAVFIEGAGPLRNCIAVSGQWHKMGFSVSGHGQTSLTVPPFVVNLNFFNRSGTLGGGWRPGNALEGALEFF